MPDYLAIKHLHVSAAGLSLALFVLRGAWRVVSPERLAARWVRVVPHVIDTVLFASALWLAWQVGRGAAPWIAAKVVALLPWKMPLGLGMPVFGPTASCHTIPLPMSAM